MNNSKEIEIRDLGQELLLRVHELNQKVKPADQTQILDFVFGINSSIAEAFSDLDDQQHSEHMLNSIHAMDTLRIELGKLATTAASLALDTLEELYIEVELAVLPLRTSLMEELNPKLEKVCI